MNTQNSYDYIFIGIMIRYLSTSNYERGMLTTRVKNNIKHLEDYLEHTNMRVTSAFMTSVTYKEILKELNSYNKERITGALQRRINKFFESIEGVIFAEGVTKTVYVMPERRYNTEYLLDQPDKFFTKDLYERLPSLAKIDIASSGRCILFGEGTASAFHLLRATEDTLRSYYNMHRKRKRLPKPMWANMLDQLKVKKQNKPPSVLLQSLDMIRESYRNPTQHPDVTYTIDQAESLFGLCLDVIGKMAEELPESDLGE